MVYKIFGYFTGIPNVVKRRFRHFESVYCRMCSYREFLLWGDTPQIEPRSYRFKVSRTHTDTDTHQVGLLWKCDQLVVEIATDTTHNKHKRQKSMPSAGFKPTIKRLQAYFCDGTANGIGTTVYLEERLICSAVYLGSKNLSKYYVYRTVHHLDSWIKRNQLDVTCFFITLFNAQHVSDVNTSETCWALNNEIKKQVTTSWPLFIQLKSQSFPMSSPRSHILGVEV